MQYQILESIQNVWENKQRRSKNIDGVHEMGGGFVKALVIATNVRKAVLESNCSFVTTLGYLWQYVLTAGCLSINSN